MDPHYPPEIRIRIILDNRSAHTSRGTRAYLASVPNRCEFVFTPTHGSWLNLIESFFAKMTRPMLRGIRVKDKAELKGRLLQYLREANRTPTIFRGRYKFGCTRPCVGIDMLFWNHTSRPC